MKSLTILFLLIGAILSMAQQKKQLTVEDIYKTGSKLKVQKLRSIRWHPDGTGFTFMKKNPDTKLYDIYLHRIDNGEEKKLFDGSSFFYDNEPISMSDYQWLKNGKYLLIRGQKTDIWRHSKKTPFYVYDINKKFIMALAENSSEIQNAKISPDGNLVAYMKDHNLHVANIQTGKAKALTTDGDANILNAVFDWVYEEEFGSADAYRWSPDGNRIAFWRLDQSPIQSFHYNLDQMPRYNIVHDVKYPKVGTRNSLVRIGVVDVHTGKTAWMDIGQDADIYIPRIYWANSSDTLIIQRLNRKQNKSELLLANVNSGASTVILTDTNPDGWVEVTDDSHIMGADQFVWTSEKSGFRHIYLYDYAGNLIRQVTSGDWVVKKVFGLDEKNGWVYFTANKETILEDHIYRVKADGTGLQEISRGSGQHNPAFSPDYKYFIDTFSNVKTPDSQILCKVSGEILRTVKENNFGLNDYDMTYPEFLTFKTTDGIELNAYMTKPANFNPDKKYPVIVYGYGGPGSQQVRNVWHGSRGLWHQMMTGIGYIIFCLDNRGTGGRGREFKNLAYGDISKWAMHDQIEGAKYLVGLPYVDAPRIGFWGWSGGGYLTCMLLTHGADYFKTGVAVAPVTDFRNYDTIWTERYMGLLSENGQGYEDANVLNYANFLKGNLLLIHGTGDDNVHLQNTIQFVQKLIDEGKQFDLMVYPNKSHGISGGNTQVHLFTKITNYFLENL